MTRHGLEEQLRMYTQSLAGKTAWDWPVAVDAWRNQARAALADGPWGYLEGGAGLEQTMQANRDAFDHWKIRPRMMNNVSDRDLTIDLFDHTHPLPFLLAPIGVQSILHPDAERATAKAAAKVGVPFVLSTVSSVAMEHVAEAMGSAPRWFQLYPGRDENIVASFLRRAKQAGYEAIVVTVDTTMLGWRETDLKNLYLPFLFGEGMANFLTDPVFLARLKASPQDDAAAAIQEFLSVYVNPAFCWADLKKIRAQTDLPLLVKGITHEDDAKRAFDAGADGIIVSNHGGRQVDGAIAALDVLPAIRAAVGADRTVLLDSGIRSAADVLKALALGANAVLLGRPYAYALAAAGQVGVEEVLAQWAAHLDLQLALSGYRRVGDVVGNTDYVTRGER